MHTYKLYSYSLLLVASTLLSGCGRHETAGGTIGATAGAIIGAGLADERNTSTGALLGGVIGNMLGGAAGRAADAEEAEEKRHYAQMRRLREQEIERREEQNRRAQAQLDRWCMSCLRQNSIEGAHRCPSCGDRLIREKFCSGCLTAFSANSSYRYCPYCNEKRVLAYR
jgi:DNA-directed RNA polymerase subunit RPC12/RpoP